MSFALFFADMQALLWIFSCLCLTLSVSTAFMMHLFHGPEPTPDPGLSKGDCNTRSDVHLTCEMCGIMGIGITTEECCLLKSAYQICRIGALSVIDTMEEPATNDMEDNDADIVRWLNLEDIFNVKRHFPASTGNHKRPHMFRKSKQA